jgi:hypothetical protein
VKISDGQITEWIALENEIHFQVLFVRVTDCKVPNGRQQDWPMKND